MSALQRPALQERRDVAEVLDDFRDLLALSGAPDVSGLSSVTFETWGGGLVSAYAPTKAVLDEWAERFGLAVERHSGAIGGPGGTYRATGVTYASGRPLHLLIAHTTVAAAGGDA